MPDYQIVDDRQVILITRSFAEVVERALKCSGGVRVMGRIDPFENTGPMTSELVSEEQLDVMRT